MLEVRVLGPLEARVDGAALPLGTRKQQTELVRLAVQAGRATSVEELIDERWPAKPATALAGGGDIAATGAQAGPLLPVSRPSVTLETSRRRLVPLDGVRPESLPVMSRDEAIELLGKVVGSDRVGAEPSAADEVARRCGYLRSNIRALVHRADEAGLYDLFGTAVMHNYIASGHQRMGRHQEAVKHLKAALELYERSGDPLGASTARANLGLVYLWLGRPEDAVVVLHEAQQKALAGIASWIEKDDPAEARRALVLFRQMKVPEQFDIERRLD
ncbi:tetratricopeptide repeat protein [Phytohabitans sp. LJ34]|uniref:tetratricopeptide repeat protein n=1 Tax=Phytohabitans sp. LJ34 TaxID=3452217 RepID=UPI003F8AF413